MADELKPPVAIRITRPFATEDEFLEREFDTLTRTSVTLLGAQPRPTGVVLRFEIVLSGGESILRGEGRVVGHKERAHGGEAGLTLRFTRLDARSKLLIDRAAALRDARIKASNSIMAMPAVQAPRAPIAPTPLRASSVPPPLPAAPPERARISSAPPPPSARRTPPPLPSTSRLAPPPPIPMGMASEPLVLDPESDDGDDTSGGLDLESTNVEALPPQAAPPPLPPPVPAASPAPPPAARAAPAPPPFVAEPLAPLPAPPRPRAPVSRPSLDAAHLSSARSVSRPDDRDALLERLRLRGTQIPPARVAEILATRAR